MLPHDPDLTPQLFPVGPTSARWHEFVARTLAYLDESWPGHGLDAAALDGELRERLAQGGRGLFLFDVGGATAGLANVYVDGDVLYVAELFIEPAERRRGLGRALLALVIDWGRRHGCRQLRVEVDRDLPRANAFWSRQSLALDDRGARNLYVGPIAPA